MTTPNMDLTLPVPGVGGTPGPEWAEEVNNNFSLIDQHDHSTGKGPLITPSGLSINANLPFNGNSPTGMADAQFISQGAALGNVNSLSVVNGELTYIDALGQVVTITANGSVAGATGSISGLSSPASAVYSSVTKSFTWSYDSAKTARMANADLILYPYDGVTAFTNAITLKAPVALAAGYSITLPLVVPTQDNVLSMDSSGVLSAGLVNGSAGSPALSFASNLTLGFYRVGANQLGVAVSGTYVASFEAAQLKLVNGTAALPAYTFNGDPNTGFYSSSADNISIATNGVLRFTFGTTSVASLLPYRGLDGTAAAPAYSFSGDVDTGMYRIGTNQLGFATAGVLALTIGSLGQINGASDISAADACGGNGGIWGGAIADVIKMKIFTGTLAADTTLDLSVPSGTIYTCVGVTQVSGGSLRVPMAVDSSSITTRVGFANVGSTTTVQRIFNRDAANSNTYRVLMYYK